MTSMKQGDFTQYYMQARSNNEIEWRYAIFKIYPIPLQTGYFLLPPRVELFKNNALCRFVVWINSQQTPGRRNKGEFGGFLRLAKEAIDNGGVPEIIAGNGKSGLGDDRGGDG
uniref:Uncharacterized protein n=1 Tax=Spongospora subterranea TaxID=70186 RepID=A0A0H5RC65_9EUKA|eukprot:CRZ11341.1 hypothetical protein [Spongospora subterranea]